MESWGKNINKHSAWNLGKQATRRKIFFWAKFSVLDGWSVGGETRRRGNGSRGEALTEAEEEKEDIAPGDPPPPEQVLEGSFSHFACRPLLLYYLDFF